jgi:L-rhamnose 1-epimerase
MKIRQAFVMSVNPGAEQEYEKRHNPIWPELEKVLQDHGVSNYSIFLHPETRQLFGYAEIESEERWASLAATEVYQMVWQHLHHHCHARTVDAFGYGWTAANIFLAGRRSMPQRGGASSRLGSL